MSFRQLRFAAGFLLLMLAPFLSELAAAYYVTGMLLGVVALGLVLLTRVTRAVPGGRTTRAVGGVLAAVGAFVVPSEHLNKVLECYASLWLAPVSLAFRLAKRGGGSTEGNASDSESDGVFSFAYALAATFSILIGAGAGAWATKSWVIDRRTGDVGDGVAAFAKISFRVLSAVLFQFSTLDVFLGGIFVALAFTALAVENAGHMMGVFSFRKNRRRQRPVGGSAYGNSDDELDGNTRSSSRASPTSLRFGGSRDSSERARSSSRGPRDSYDDDDDDDDDEPNTSPSWSWISRGGGDRPRALRRRGSRKKSSPVTTMDPEPKTPPAILTGVGSLGAVRLKSPGRTPGLGLKPWRLLQQMTPFAMWGGGGGAPGRDDDSDEDADGDALGDARLLAAARTAASSLGSRGGGGKPVGLRKGNRGKESVQDRTAPRNDVPVGMAARSRGRFMTQTEFEDTGAASTDTGLGTRFPLTQTPPSTFAHTRPAKGRLTSVLTVCPHGAIHNTDALFYLSQDALCGTPEFAKWMRQQAHRVRLTSRDFSDSDDG